MPGFGHEARCRPGKSGAFSGLYDGENMSARGALNIKLKRDQRSPVTLGKTKDFEM